MNYVSIKLILKNNPKKINPEKNAWIGNRGYILGNETRDDFVFSFFLLFIFLSTALQSCFWPKHVEAAPVLPSSNSGSQGVHVIGPRGDS